MAGIGIVALLWFALVVAASIWMARDARHRGATDLVAVLVGAVGFFTAPVGQLVYLLLAATGHLDKLLAATTPD